MERGSVEAAIEARDVLLGVVVDVAGVPMSLRASDLRRAEAVASLFRHAAPADALDVCSIYFGGGDVAVPDTEAPTVAAGAELWWSPPGQLWIRSEEGLTARCTHDEIVVGGDADALARIFRYVCLLGLMHLLAHRNWYLLHAGAVVTDHGALLVVGDTGTGKSTLVFAAHRLGWPVLADDAVAVCRRDGFVMARGLPRPISVPADVVNEVIADGRPVLEDHRKRTELPGGTLAAATHPVVGVVVTTRGSAQHSSLDPMTGHEVLGMVMRASLALAERDLRPETLAIAGALARLPGWSLRNGADPTAALDDVSRHLHALSQLLRDGAPS